MGSSVHRHGIMEIDSICKFRKDAPPPTNNRRCDKLPYFYFVIFIEVWRFIHTHTTVQAKNEVNAENWPLLGLIPPLTGCCWKGSSVDRPRISSITSSVMIDPLKAAIQERPSLQSTPTLSIDAFLSYMNMGHSGTVVRNFSFVIYFHVLIM